MGKAVQFKDENGEKYYAHPYWPVGSIYMSINSENPSVFFGGTWERIAQGRTLIGVDENDADFNEVSKTGGNKNLQEHYHEMRYSGPSGSGVSISATGSGTDVLCLTAYEWTKNLTNAFGSGSNVYTNNAGTGNSGNLQPYLTCYIWHRIA